MHFPEPDQRQCHVGQRRQIARGSDGSLARNHRDQIRIEQRDRLLQQFLTNPAVAECKVVDAQREGEPTLLLPQRCANAGRVTQQQVALQLQQLVVGDSDTSQFAETGVDPVLGGSARDRGRDHVARGLDSGAHLASKSHA